MTSRHGSHVLVLESTRARHRAPAETAGETGASDRSVARRLSIALVSNDTHAIDMAATRTEAVRHGNRHLANTRPDARVVNVDAARLDAVRIATW